MHDAFGRELKVGDRVMVPMIVKGLHLSEGFCNCQLEGVATMPPEHAMKVTLSAVNTQQILRANEGDDLAYATRTYEPYETKGHVGPIVKLVSVE